LKDTQNLNRICLLCAVLIAVFAAEAQPVITQQPTNETVNVGSNVNFSVSVSGTGPFTYQWRLNGTNLPTGIITTVAGNGLKSFSGDGGAATNASFNGAYGVAVDNSSNIFIADFVNGRVRIVYPDGNIYTVAGGGTSLSDPSGVAVDANGKLIIADPGANRIGWKSFGTIITVAGNGTASFSGDGGPATNATLNDPFGVALDAKGNLFIADTDNSRIRKVNTNGIITTVAGNGSPSFSGDGDTATSAGLYNPSGVAVDARGNLFIADGNNHRVRKVSTNGFINTVAGNGVFSFSGDGGAATSASLVWPTSVAVDASGNLFIADQSNNRIRRVNSSGIITTIAGNGTASFSGDGGPASNATLNSPSGLALDASGNLLIADNYNNRVRKMNITGLPTLNFTNVLPANAGYYSVIISSAAGSVTSSVASLTVALPGYNQITGQFLGGGKIRLSFVGNAGGKYALDRSSSLAPPNWIPQVTNPAAANGNLVFTNTANSTTNNFWRIRSVP
jgi:sugar lactone lactonase YvrE